MVSYFTYSYSKRNNGSALIVGRIKNKITIVSYTVIHIVLNLTSLYNYNLIQMVQQIHNNYKEQNTQ